MPRPFAYVDLDLLDRNIAAIAAAAGNKRVRVASKSVRCVGLLRRILDASDVYRGVMCYTAEEALFLARQGFDDLLLGYPNWQRGPMAELIRLIGEGRTITFMVDCLEQVELIERLAADAGIVVPLCVDLDMSSDYPGLRFGVWRSPLSSWEDVQPLAERIVRSRWVRLDGLMGYEAQIAGVGDRVEGQAAKSAIVRFLKKRSIREVARRRAEVISGLARLDVTLRLVNGGGTGSFLSTREEEGVTELTAGSGFYSPGLFDDYRDFRYEPAVGFAVDIVRQPRPDIFTCLGGGYIASGSAEKSKLPKPYLPQGLSLFPMEGAGEVQTPLRYEGALPLRIGDPVFFRHAKAGELCERFPVLHAVSGGKRSGEFQTYRGMGQCFL